MHSIVYKLFGILDSHLVVLVSSKLEVVISFFYIIFLYTAKQIGCSNHTVHGYHRVHSYPQLQTIGREMVVIRDYLHKATPKAADSMEIPCSDSLTDVLRVVRVVWF